MPASKYIEKLARVNDESSMFVLQIGDIDKLLSPFILHSLFYKRLSSIFCAAKLIYGDLADDER